MDGIVGRDSETIKASLSIRQSRLREAAQGNPLNSHERQPAYELWGNPVGIIISRYSDWLQGLECQRAPLLTYHRAPVSPFEALPYFGASEG